MVSDVWSFDAVPQAAGAARQAILRVADRYHVLEEVRDAIELCVSEAVTNAVVHGYRGRGGRGQLEASHRDGELCVSIRDDGAGLAPYVDSPGLGLGLPLMANLSARFEVRSRSGGGTEIVLHFPLP
jgi:stage II sporulation protein AB (anti-sigma F factor)